MRLDKAQLALCFVSSQEVGPDEYGLTGSKFAGIYRKTHADSLDLDFATICALCFVRLSRTHVMSLGIAEACQMPQIVDCSHRRH